MPEDDPELGLDPGGGWYDEELEKDVMELPRPLEKPTQPKKRSRVSVRRTLSYCIGHDLIFFLAKASRGMERKTPGSLP